MKAETKAVEFKYIVGIGASAGGLEALQKLLSALPANTGFPYIIIQHLSPDYKSLLGEILGKYTDMPVVQADDGMEIQGNHVYVIQPGKNMRLEDGKLRLTDQIPKELNLPIDMFFRSLAEEAGPRAIAIVLSGTGSDGTNGIKAVKENDGMIIVQDLGTSKFDGMPRSAMRTGLVDVQISPEEIALELQHISGVSDKSSHEKTEQEIDSELMKKVYMILKKVSNVNFTHYKQSTILRRMERRMMLTHKDKLSDYVQYLCETPDEVKTLSKEVLIGVTNFFRDPDFFQSLKEKAIPDILSRSVTEEPVRVWVAGCSTGEEAYSIAILFSEVMEALKVRRDVKIFATDLDVEAINTAGKGVYGDNIVDSVSTARLSRYFTRRNNTYTINRDIRKMIVFSPHNVFQDPPFGRLDLISCRNMLIYFQPVLQNDLFAIFHQALRDGGFLFLGKSEAIGSYTEAFPVVDAAAKIFTHRADATIPGAKKVPYLQTTYLDDEFMADSDIGFPRPAARGELGYNEEASIDTRLLEQYMPACLIVNEKNEMIHSYVITLVDVTMQKQGQVQLEDTEKKLLMAKEVVEAKSDYLSRITHEIRTPMGALIGLAKLTRQQSGNPTLLGENLEKISNTIQYMASIVSDISEASRIERDMLEEIAEPFALREVIENVVLLVAGRAKDAGLAFEATMADDFAPCYVGNKTALQQILINFLNNAIKYTPQGGSVGLKAFEDGLDEESGKAVLCLVVSDTGIGIKEAFLPKIFDPFTRETSGDKEESASMGLGLSIAHNLINSMNGDVSVQSEVGKGSTFTIRLLLPHYDAKSKDDDVLAHAAERSLQGYNILVAEDNALNRTILCALLASEGMTFVEAADGEAAVKAYMDAPEKTFHCILMDMRMPKLDGIRATSLIRESGKGDAKTIPIIGVSANGFADDIRQARQAGINEYTTKPIDRERLFSAMRAMIRRE